MAKVISINISEKRGTVKTPVESAVFVEGKGIEGDAHFGLDDIKQISLLAEESIDKMRKEGFDFLVPGIFAENITTEGIILKNLPIGTRLKIGETIQEVSKIGKECHTDCEIKQKAGKCIMPLEGIFTRVKKGGTVKKGDEIEII
jgi:MOSC domain-containing protein YiiM